MVAWHCRTLEATQALTQGGIMTVIVPVVHSTRRGVNSDLAAAFAMAVAFARRDLAGDLYRAALEEAMGVRAVPFLHGIQAAHHLFPDIPMPTYTAQDLQLDDVLTLVRLAQQRSAHLLPVFAVNAGQLDAAQAHRGTCAIVLRVLDDGGGADRSMVGAYWDPGAPPGSESIDPDRAALATAFRECAVIGELPPARP